MAEFSSPGSYARRWFSRAVHDFRRRASHWALGFLLISGLAFASVAWYRATKMPLSNLYGEWPWKWEWRETVSAGDLFFPTLIGLLIVVVPIGGFQFFAAPFRMERDAAPVVSMASAAPLDDQPTVVTLSAPGDTGGRVFVPVSVTPASLIALRVGEMDAHAEARIAPFLNKWMRVRGPLDNLGKWEPIVFDPGPGWFSATLMGAPGDAAVVITSRTRSDFDQLEVARKGDTVTVVGQIGSVSSAGVFLGECELESVE